MNPFHNVRGRFAKSPRKSRKVTRNARGRFASPKSKYTRNARGRFASPKSRRNMTRRRR